MRRIDDDTRRGKSEVVVGGNPSHHMGFHVDCDRAGGPVQFALFGRVGDRHINAKDRRVDGALNLAKEFARPHRIGIAHGLRFLNC